MREDVPPFIGQDTPADCGGFVGQGADDHGAFAGQGAVDAAPSISVIVPVYNEEAVLENLLAQLRPLRGQCEIIFVDGGSTDRTLEIIGDEFRVISSRKGRGHQLNVGARASTGDILFFLHADSELPPDSLGEIRRVMRTHEVGCFGVAFRSRNFFMLTCRVMSNLRCYVRRIMFGDQGIFIKRDLFFEVGGFPDLPIMEDYQLSLSLRSQGHRIGATRRRIYSSPRRFGPTTADKLLTMYHMHRLRYLYRRGMPAEDIARAYADVR